MKRVLIANRGEIACRTIRTVQSMGLQAIAVYSDADKDAMHVRCADDALRIGPAPAAESYLNSENLLAAAREAGCDSIHPGYGFLSENAEFATACDEAGLAFIGPSANAIALMGDKAAAKRHMIGADVPCIPGYEESDQSDDRLIRAAQDIGFPVMVKAAAGGGGRGMRRVEGPEKLEAALQTARSESLGAFGSDTLIIEKALDGARHVEIQVLADQNGHCIHLGERDCSVQRRHQKILEESPCPILTQELREQMGEAAVRAAQSIDYTGAGTVEFLVTEGGEFYFLEMNTRLQVEHPVTELVTGLDLVEWQLRIARGEALPLQQAEIELEGHAIEARLYAEDPGQGFLPSTGRIQVVFPSLDGIRVDTGVESGSQVSPHYDAMMAKIIARGRDRREALDRLRMALRQTHVLGVQCNRDFLLQVLATPDFEQGRFDTGFVDTHWPDGFSVAEASTDQVAVAAVLSFCLRREQAQNLSLGIGDELVNFASGRSIGFPVAFADQPKATVTPTSASNYVVRVNDAEVRVTLENWQPERLLIVVNNRRMTVSFCEGYGGILSLATDHWNCRFERDTAAVKDAAVRAGVVIAPMHGQVMDVLIREGETVTQGQPLLILEAMKMQHEVCATVDGMVRSLPVASGQQVAAQSILLEIE